MKDFQSIMWICIGPFHPLVIASVSLWSISLIIATVVASLLRRKMGATAAGRLGIVTVWVLLVGIYLASPGLAYFATQSFFKYGRSPSTVICLDLAQWAFLAPILFGSVLGTLLVRRIRKYHVDT